MAAAEPPSAAVAGERLLALVDQDVRFELIGVREARVAQLASVGFLARVDAKMPPQIGHLDELTVAVFTVIRFFTRMQPHMCFEVVVPGKALVTLHALEGLLARVSSFVVLEDMLVAEGPLAHQTRKLLVSGRVRGGRRRWRRGGRWGRAAGELHRRPAPVTAHALGGRARRRRRRLRHIGPDRVVVVDTVVVIVDGALVRRGRGRAQAAPVVEEGRGQPAQERRLPHLTEEGRVRREQRRVESWG